jgi:hypothetical protein
MFTSVHLHICASFCLFPFLFWLKLNACESSDIEVAGAGAAWPGEPEHVAGTDIVHATNLTDQSEFRVPKTVLPESHFAAAVHSAFKKPRQAASCLLLWTWCTGWTRGQ